MNASDPKAMNGKHESMFSKILVTVVAASIVGAGSSYMTMRLELGDMSRRLAFVEKSTSPAMIVQLEHITSRVNSNDNTMSEFRKSIEDLNRSILPELERIRTNLEYIKNDISRLSRLYELPAQSKERTK